MKIETRKLRFALEHAADQVHNAFRLDVAHGPNCILDADERTQLVEIESALRQLSMRIKSRRPGDGHTRDEAKR